MTTDRLAALLHEELHGDAVNQPCWAGCADLAARLAAQGVTVGLDVEKVAAVLRECWPTYCSEIGDDEVMEDAADFARAYAATPQPAEEEGR